MNIIKKATSCLILVCVGQVYAMRYARVTEGPMAGKIAKIVGTTQETWGIEDVWTSRRSFSICAIAQYIMKNPPYSGKVFYGKVEGMGHCFHESWLKEINKNEAKNELAETAEKYCHHTSGGVAIFGPKWFVDAMTHEESGQNT